MSAPVSRRVRSWAGLLAVIAALAVAVAAVPGLRVWFFPPATAPAPRPSSTMPDESAGPPVPAPVVSLPPIAFESAALESLSIALEAYEDARRPLASDSIDGVADAAQRSATALAAASPAVESPLARTEIEKAAESARALAAADSLDSARAAFGTLSQSLVAIATADPRLRESRHLFYCPMADGFAHWMQPGSEIQNPYMGPKMLTCGSKTTWPETAAPSKSVSGTEHGAVHHYTCPMHPSIRASEPGPCPICGMDLVAVTEAEMSSGVVFVDEARRARIGVKTATVEEKHLSKTIRTVGRVAYDESRMVDVSLKYKGWVERLVADAVGKKVTRGQTLFTVYSPDVYATQQELVIATRTSGPSEGVAARRPSFSDAARRRLELWDVPKGVIDKVAKTGEPMRAVPVASPASGYVVEKNVVEGAAIEPGARLFRIANLEKVWIQAELYESELPLVREGMPARVTLSYLPDKRFEGKVAQVYPYLSGATRTGQIRVELENRDVELKPEMYANITLETDLGKRVVVPESAVIYAGPRRVVFVDLGGGRLKPVDVEVGAKVGDAYEVLSGLKAGDVVVTSGNFLIAAESRLKSAEGKW